MSLLLFELVLLLWFMMVLNSVVWLKMIRVPMGDGQLPRHLQDWLDGWGSQLKRSMAAACEEAWAESGVQSSQSSIPSQIRVGTDCSGIEAPVHALNGIGLSYKHLWSSEIADAPRKVLLANTPPEQIFSDVLRSSQGEPPPWVHLYLSGFSCKPFSTLHHQTKLLQEEEARVFFAVVDRIHQVRPSCFVLENVLGIQRIQSQVQDLLTSSGLYTVLPLKMDPADLGEPVHRPRVYFFGVRKDVALGPEGCLSKVLAQSWKAVKSKVRSSKSNVSLMQRLLPSWHPAVVEHQSFRRLRWQKAWCLRNFFSK